MQCPRCAQPVPAQATRCRSCGAEIPPGQALLEESGVVGPSTSPTRAKVGFSRGYSRLASLGDRSLAVLLDSTLLVLAWSSLSAFFAARSGTMTENGFYLTAKFFALSLLVITGAGLLYFLIFEALFGATIGKAIMGLEVRTVDGGPLGLKGSLLRNLLRLADGLGAYLLGFLVATCSGRRQRIGDHIAQTVVLETESGALKQGAMSLLWVLLLAAGLGSVGLLYESGSVSLPAGGSGGTFSVSWARRTLAVRLPYVNVRLGAPDEHEISAAHSAAQSQQPTVESSKP